MTKKPVFTNVLQVGVVVRDLDDAVRRYADVYGIGPWRIYNFRGTQGNMVIRDQPATFAMRLAVCDIGTVNWELIEPLGEAGTFAEFLRERGEGIHHVCFATDDAEATIAHARSCSPRGIGVLQAGSITAADPGFRYTFMDTADDLGFIAEIWQVRPGFTRPPPDAVYPSPKE